MKEENQKTTEQTEKKEEQSSEEQTSETCKKKPGLKKKIFTGIAIGLAVIITFVSGYFSRYLFEPSSVSTMGDLVRIIESFGYVIDENGNPRPLTDADYAKALVDGLLDDYSYYYTKEEYSVIEQKRGGAHSGFGVSYIEHKDKNAEIYKTIGNSPAERSGILKGDVIIGAKIGDGQRQDFSKAEQCSNFMETVGLGQSVTFYIDRAGTEMEFTLSPENYTASYVTYYDNERKMCFRTTDGTFGQKEIPEQKLSILDDDHALIKLDQFEGGAASQLSAALSYMQAKGRTKLILDLRNNGGGYMDVLCDIASYFIINGEKRTVIAYAQGKSSWEEYTMRFAKAQSFTDIAVIANDGTASAPECLIGAMLTYKEKFDKSRLIIEKNADGVAKTYGKGIMQTTYLMYNGGAFKLTTARVLWPDASTCIHNRGIIAEGENAVVAGDAAIVRANAVLNIPLS